MSLWGIIRRHPRRYAALTVLLYNNWLLGFILNPTLSPTRATISELSAADQPYHLVFRMLDIIAGGLIVLAIPRIGRLFSRIHLRWPAYVAIGIMGFGNILDALMSLDCAPSQSELCRSSQQLGMLSWWHTGHLIESMVVAIVLALPPLLLHLEYRKLPGISTRLSRWLISALALWAIFSFVSFMMDWQLEGYLQRLFMVALAVWLYRVLTVVPKVDPSASKPKPKSLRRY